MKLERLRKRKSIVFREYDIVDEIDDAALLIIDKGFSVIDFNYLRKHVVKKRISNTKLNETIIQCFYNLGVLGLKNDGCVSDVLTQDADPKDQVRNDIWLYLVSIGLANMCFGNEQKRILNRYKATKKFKKLFA